MMHLSGRSLNVSHYIGVHHTGGPGMIPPTIIFYRWSLSSFFFLLRGYCFSSISIWVAGYCRRAFAVLVVSTARAWHWLHRLLLDLLHCCICLSYEKICDNIDPMTPTKNLQLCCTYGIVLIVGHISGGERHLFVFIFFKKLNAFLRLVFRSDTMACDLIVYSVYCTQSRICVVVLWPQSLYICRRKNRHINYQLVHWMSTGRSNGLMWWTNTRTLGVLSVDGFVCSSRYTLLVSIDMQRHRIRVDSSSYCGAIA